MKKVYHVCTKEVTYNGKKYYPGYPWLPEDGGDPPPVGTDWVIRQDDDAESPQMGFVQWKPQPGRIQPSSLTPPEKAILAENPYANLDEPAPAPPPPPAEVPLLDKKKPAPTISAHLLMTEEDINDPFGLKARAAATTAELRLEIEEKDSAVDSAEKE